MDETKKTYTFEPRLSILEQCDGFIKDTVNPAAPEIQKHDMKMAFMAGAYSLLQTMVSDSFMSKDEAQKNLKNLFDDFRDFFSKVELAAENEKKLRLMAMKADLG